MSKRAVNLLRKIKGDFKIQGANIVTESTEGLRDSRTLRAAATAGAARTAITATALSVNTHYSGETATGLAMTIPSAAAGAIGDWITVLWTTNLNDGVQHTFTTTTDTAYALGSIIVRIGGQITSAVDVSVAADNVITLEGDTNGDGGAGTTLKLVNLTGALNGWAAELKICNRGTGATAMASAFS